MSLLRSISKEEATGSIAATYQMMEKRVGMIPNVIGLHTASPSFFDKFMQITGHYIDHPSLDPVLVSYIRILVSHREGGEYCVRLQSAFLQKFGVDPLDLEAALTDPRNVRLEAGKKELILFVLDMMYDQLTDTRDRIASLKLSGWTEQDIYEASMLAGIQKGVVKVIRGFDVAFDF